MPAENSENLLSPDIGNPTLSSMTTSFVSDQVDLVSAALTEVVVSNHSENDISKLTAQDLVDLEQIQAELDSLTSSYPESGNPSVTTTANLAATFSDTSVVFSNATTVPVSGTMSLDPMLASNPVTQTLALDTQTVVTPQTTSLPPQTTVLPPKTTASTPKTIILAPQNTLLAPQSSLITPQSTISAPQTAILAPQTNTLVPKTNVLTPKTTVVALQTTVSSGLAPKIATSSNTLTTPQVPKATVLTSQNVRFATALNPSGSTSFNVKPLTVGQNIMVSSASLNNLPMTFTTTSSQPGGGPMTLNFATTTTLKGGKQVIFVQKPGSSTQNSILNQGRVLTVSPTKNASGATVLGAKRQMVIPVSNASGPAVTLPPGMTSFKAGDVRFVMPQNMKGGQLTGTGGLTFSTNNLSFIQAMGGKQASAQILNKVKLVNVPGGAQLTTASTSVAGAMGGNISLVDQTSGQKSTQPQTIFLASGASPNKTLTLARAGGNQLLRAVPGGSSRPGVFVLSPVKGKAGVYQNLTLKSPTRSIAPAPNSAKVTLASGASVSGLTFTTTTKTSASTASPQKIMIRNIVPVNAKPNMGGTTVATTVSANAASNQKQTVSLSGMQQIQVPGSKFNYVRLVSAPANQGTATVSTSLKSGTLIPVSSVRSITPNTSTVSSAATKPLMANVTVAGTTTTVRIAMPVQQTTTMATTKTSAKTTTTNQRVIIPSNARIIDPATGNPAAGNFSHFPPGSIISTGNNAAGMPSFVMVSAQYVAQLQQQSQTNGAPRMILQSASNVLPQSGNVQSTTNFVPIAAAVPVPPRPLMDHQASQAIQSNAVPPNRQNGTAAVIETTESRPRKPCNCTKSQCLKLYCDCFANGEFCHSCNCTNCYNNLEHEEERQKAIKSCLDRNPQAFHPKIGKTRRGRDGDHERRHTKGCNCKRSGCLKNYCECYEAKILCTNLCKCNGCKNFEDSNERKTLMHLADAAEVRVQQQAAAKTKISSQIQDMPIRPSIVSLTGERLPFSFVTADVTEATLDCMLARAEDGERSDVSIATVEKQILEEFGRCLYQIIDCANKTRGK